MTDKFITHPDFTHFKVVAEIAISVSEYDTYDPDYPGRGYSISEVGRTRPPRQDCDYCVLVVGKLRPWLDDDHTYVCYDDGDIFLLELEDTRGN